MAVYFLLLQVGDLVMLTIAATVVGVTIIVTSDFDSGDGGGVQW